MALQIIKASGLSETFDISKLVTSLVRSGAPAGIARDIAEKVESRLTRPVHTKEIFRMAKKLLRQYSRPSGMRYSIKKAIHDLGPTGYPFEKYFARILSANGYATETNRLIKGFCVTHEVDVFASKDSRRCIVECKYHASGEKPTDVKIALYVHARFNDIKRELERGDNGSNYEGWLVTNTRATVDAVAYAECVGLKIVSWRYPEGESLERMIDAGRLYPVTVLPAATRSALHSLLANDIILADEIAVMSTESFLGRSGLDRQTALLLKRQADELCVGGPGEGVPGTSL